QSLAAAVFGVGVPHLDALEASFRGDPQEVTVAYAAARDLVNHLRYRDGDGADLRQLLGQVRMGRSFDGAVLSAYGATLEELEAEWRGGLSGRFSWFPMVSSGGMPFFVLAPLFGIAFFRRRRQIRERERSDIKLSPNGKPCAVNNPVEAWTIIENAHEPLIDKALFDRVQARLAARMRSNPGVGYRTHTKTNGDVYVLSGLLYCNHCGRRMTGMTARKDTKGKETRHRRYICPTYVRCGRNNPNGCGNHVVEQDLLVKLLKRKLRGSVFSDASLKALRENLEALVERRREGGGQSVEAVRRRIAELGREIDQASENFLRAPSKLLDLIAEKLTALKRQKENAEQELRAMEIANSPMDAASEMDDAIAQLERLGAALDDVDVSRQRAVLQSLIERIELRFDRLPSGKGFKYPLLSGVIHVRTVSGGPLYCASRGGR
ncbi:MAG TPA: recombinase zinc beta ribbon domain-containing protein, partial [Pirellulaceae bacterium]|nr:recombinase zinc beta ribbon domain-containing protein [Pirellulaceae bacterium]